MPGAAAGDADFFTQGIGCQGEVHRCHLQPVVRLFQLAERGLVPFEYRFHFEAFAREILCDSVGGVQVGARGKFLQIVSLGQKPEGSRFEHGLGGLV